MSKPFTLMTLVVAVFAGAVQVSAESKSALIVESAPWYDNPAPAQLPQGFFEKMDSCIVDTAVVDSAGTPWFKVHKGSRQGWVAASKVRYTSEIKDDFFTAVRSDDADKKRRLSVLRQHENWPRRIKLAVRNGSVCLDMTAEQVVAAWDKPVRTGKAFVLGVGTVTRCYFGESAATVLCVDLQNDRVIGWSTDE